MDPATTVTSSALLWRTLLAYVLLSAALLPHNGGLGPLAVPPFLACAYLLLDTVRRLPLESRAAAVPALRPRQWRWLLGALALLAVTRPPGIYLREGTPLWVFPLFTAALLGLALYGQRDGLRARQRDGLAAAMVLIVLVAGGWVLRASPNPRIDLYSMQQLGAGHLLAGRDPYAVSYPNFYTPAESVAYFGAAVTELPYYPYPPLSLLVTTAAFWVGGDTRLAFLALHLSTGILLYAIARRRAGATAMGLLALHLLSPRGLFMLEQSWTEPLLSACIAAWAFCALRPGPASTARRIGEVLLLAAVFSAKQYSVLLLPLVLAPRFRPRESATSLLRTTALAAALAAALLLPFLLWHPRDLFEDLVLFQVRQPFRPDALTLPALFHFVTGLRAPGALALLGITGTLVWAWRRLPQKPAGLLYGAALGCFGFFALAKQAFCNYYSLVAVLLLLSAAASVRDAEP